MVSTRTQEIAFHHFSVLGGISSVFIFSTQGQQFPLERAASLFRIGQSEIRKGFGLKSLASQLSDDSGSLFIIECDNQAASQLYNFLHQYSDNHYLPNVRFILLTKEYDQQLAISVNHRPDSYYLAGDIDDRVLRDYLIKVMSPEDVLSSFHFGLESEFGRSIGRTSIISATDAKGDIRYANENFCKLSGYENHELLGKNHRILKSGVHPESFYREMWSTLHSGSMWQGEVCNKTKTGEFYWVQAYIFPITSNSGKIHSYLSVRYDITESKRKQQSLELTTRRFEISHSYANVGTWDWNILTGSLYWSEEIHRLFGYDEPLLQTTYENFLNAIHPDDRAVVQERVTACLENGEPYSAEHRVVYPNGDIRWLQERGSVIRDTSGTAIRMLGVVSDIHDLKISQQRALYEEKSKALLISSLSHELRNPLNAISGYIDIIQREKLTDRQSKYASRTKNAVEYITDVLNNIRLSSQLEASAYKVVLDLVDLDELINECIALCTINQSKIKPIYTDSSLRVSADKTALKQILINLISNAIKYNTAKGTVDIYASELPSGTVRIGVIDSGEGLSAEEIEVIFEPYERLDWKLSEVEGLGLGLPISNRLARLMGSQINVDSIKGSGSEFWLELPSVSEQLITSTPELTQQEDNPTSEKPAIIDINNALVLEDDTFNQEVIKEHLNAIGIRSYICGEGRSGLIALNKKTFDLIITDLNMPEIDGKEFIQKVREDCNYSSIPIIVVTAKQEDEDELYALGASSVLIKPYSLSQLEAAIRDTKNCEKLDIPTADRHEQLLNSSISQFSQDVLKHHLGTDIVKHKKFITLYLSSALNNISQMTNYLASGKRKEISLLAHKISSSTLCLGGELLYGQLKEIENTAETWSLLELNSYIDQFIINLKIFLEELYQYLDTLSDAQENLAISEIAAAARTVLILDDDIWTLQHTESVLHDIDTSLNVVKVSSAKQALSYLQDNDTNLIIFDINMPEMDGIQFIRKLSENYKGEELIVSSSKIDLISPVIEITKSFKMNYIGQLKKPAIDEQLSGLLDKCFKKYSGKTSKANSLSDKNILRFIKEGRLILHYQPQICAKSKKVIATESLARLIDDDESVIPPAMFLGRLRHLDIESLFAISVAEIAIEQLSKWHSDGLNFKMAINFSMTALEDLSLPDRLVELCAEFDIKPQDIIIEVTEQELPKDQASSLEVLGRLKLRDFVLSVDDFGTGYASLDKLRVLPFSELKLDRSYVSTAREDSKSMALLVNLISLAIHLQYKTVAEGIENEDDLELVQLLGADCIQGFYYTKPLPANDFCKWFKEWQDDS